MIELLLKISILIWPFGHLLSYRLAGLNIYLLDIFLFMLAIAVVGSKSGRKAISEEKNSKYLWVFLIVASLSLLVNLPNLSSGQSLKALFYLARLIIYPAIFYAIRIINWKNIKSSVITSVSSFVVLSLAQYLIFPDATSLKYLGFDDHYYRLIGTLFDPNFTGLILVVICLFFLSQSKYIYSLLIVPAIALTFSRASFVVLVLGTIYISIRKNLKISLALLAVLVIAIVFSPKPFGEGVNLFRTFSIFSRIDSWNVGLKLFAEKPIFGWGYNTLTDINGQRIGIDNSFIYLLATTGILGFSSFIVLLFRYLKGIKNQSYLVCIAAILTHSLFLDSPEKIKGCIST